MRYANVVDAAPSSCLNNEEIIDLLFTNELWTYSAPIDKKLHDSEETTQPSVSALFFPVINSKIIKEMS